MAAGRGDKVIGNGIKDLGSWGVMWVVPVGAEFTQGEGKTEGAGQAGRCHLQ